VGAIAILWCAVAGISPVDAKPNAPPPELLASVAIGPVTTFRGLQAYAEAIRPGSGAMLTDQVVRHGIAAAVGASSLDGLDPVSWMYLLVIATSGDPEVALLGKVADAKALETAAGTDHLVTGGGWAVIGARPLIDRIGPYALSAIAPQPAPRAPSATVYLPQVVARYHTQLEAVRTQLLASFPTAGPGPVGKFFASYIDGLASLVTDAERVVVMLEATPDLASLDLALMPRPRSRLATFVGSQRPSEFALLARLPATTPAVLVGGHVELGPYREGVLAMLATVYGPEASHDMLATLGALTKVMTGEIAAAMQFGRGTGLAFTQLYGVTDTRAANKALASFLALFKTGRVIDMPNMSTTITTNPDTATHDGVVLRSYDTSYDFSMAPEDQRKLLVAMNPGGMQHVELAAFDSLGVIVAGPDSRAEVGRVIDAVRDKAPRFAAPHVIDDLLAASRAHKDSVALVMDLGVFVAMATGAPMGSGTEPALLSFGTADRTLHIRIALPATTLRAMTAVKP
jgi:hypothetical protein